MPSYGIDIQLYIRKHSSRTSSYGFFIQLCIRKYSYSSSSYEVDIQLCSQHTLNIELWDRHSAIPSKTYLLNIELLHQHSTLHSKPKTLWMSSYGFDFHLCIHKYLGHRAIRSTFRSAFKTIHTLIIELWVRHSALTFENIHLEYRAVWSIFSSAFKIIHSFE